MDLPTAVDVVCGSTPPSPRLAVVVAVEVAVAVPRPPKPVPPTQRTDTQEMIPMNLSIKTIVIREYTCLEQKMVP